DMRVVTEDDVRAGIDDFVRELSVFFVDLLRVLTAPVERHHDVVYLISDPPDVLLDNEWIQRHDAGPVRQRECRRPAVDELGVAEKREPDAVPLDHERPAGIFQVTAATDAADSSAGQCIDRIEEAHLLCIEGVIVGDGYDVDSGPT